MTVHDTASESYSELIRVRVKPSMKRAIAEAARRQGIDESEYVRHALATVLNGTIVVRPDTGGAEGSQ